MTRRKQPEGALQKAVAQLLDSLGWLWFHPAGEMILRGTKEERAKQMARLKAQGFKRSMPDVIVEELWTGGAHDPNKCDTCHDARPETIGGINGGFGVAIELKAGSNTTTPGQDEWLEAFKARGRLTAVCYTMDEVMDVLRHVRPLNGRRL